MGQCWVTITTDLSFVRRFHTFVLVFVPRVGYLDGTREMFGFVLVSDKHYPDTFVAMMVD